MPKHSTTQAIRLERIQHPPDHNRNRDEANIERLKQSIKLLGLLNPITVIAHAEHYYVIAGFHRLAACRRLGHQEISCTVLDPETTDGDALAISIAENHVRQNESFTDTVRRLERIMKVEKCSFAEAARKSCTNASFASKCLQCERKLSAAAKEFLSANRTRLGISVAYEIATKAADEAQQLTWLQAVLNGDLTRDGIAELAKQARSDVRATTSLRLACEDVEISLRLPKASDYDKLLAAVGMLKSRLLAEQKHGTPVHVLPELLG